MPVRPYWKQASEESEAIYQQTAKHCTTELTLLSDSFDVFASAFDAIPTSGNGEATIVRLSLLSQALNTFYAAIHNAARGYYIQSLIPLRHIYESWLSFWYLAKQPEAAARWLDPRKRPPRAKTMLDHIDHPSAEIKSRVREFYGELNRFIHVDPVAVISRLHPEEAKTIVGVGVRFDPEDFRACAYGIGLWIGNLMDAASSLIPNGAAWHDHYRQITDRILEMIDSYDVAHKGSPIPPSQSHPDAA